MYFIHNKYDDKSIAMLEKLESGIKVIDYYTDQQAECPLYSNLDTSGMPCIVDELKYVSFIAQAQGIEQPKVRNELEGEIAHIHMKLDKIMTHLGIEA